MRSFLAALTTLTALALVPPVPAVAANAELTISVSNSELYSVSSSSTQTFVLNNVDSEILLYMWLPTHLQGFATFEGNSRCGGQIPLYKCYVYEPSTITMRYNHGLEFDRRVLDGVPYEVVAEARLADGSIKATAVGTVTPRFRTDLVITPRYTHVSHESLNLKVQLETNGRDRAENVTVLLDGIEPRMPAPMNCTSSGTRISCPLGTVYAWSEHTIQLPGCVHLSPLRVSVTSGTVEVNPGNNVADMPVDDGRFAESCKELYGLPTGGGPGGGGSSGGGPGGGGPNGPTASGPSASAAADPSTSATPSPASPSNATTTGARPTIATAGGPAGDAGLHWGWLAGGPGGALVLIAGALGVWWWRRREGVVPPTDQNPTL